MHVRRIARFAAAIAIALGLSSSSIAGAKPLAASREPAAASQTPRKARDAKAPTKPQGTLSIGAPNRGRLTGGMRLRGARPIELRPGARSWGLPALVRLLRRSAATIAKKHSGSFLVVGDLSAKRGGPIDGHNSHQSGRDVDIGFFVANSKGKPMNVKRFIAFDGTGKGRDFTWARFDEARNWSLVEALLKDEEAAVRYIFVAHGLRARLLDHAAKKRVPKEIIARAASAMISPREAELHDDHFHVRIACPETMRGVCIEEPSAREGPPLPGAASAGGQEIASGRAMEAQPNAAGAPLHGDIARGNGTGAPAGASTAEEAARPSN